MATERPVKGIIEIGRTKIPWKRDDATLKGAAIFPVSMVSQFLKEYRVVGKNMHTIEQLVKYLSSSQHVDVGTGPWLSPDGFLKLVYLFGTAKHQILATKAMIPFISGASSVSGAP